VQQFQRPKVDAILWKDPRSRSYGVRRILTAERRQKTVWLPSQRSFLPLDQGSEGECVGFGWSGELQVPPIEIPVHNQFARNFYAGARQIDREEGRFFNESGATVLAGAKLAKKMGWISEYAWCFGMEDLKDTVCTRGPVVLGINWYAGMYSTDTQGLIWVNGELAGGHCILCVGYEPNHPQFGEGFWLLNSWGKTWGLNGLGFLRDNDMRRLLVTEQGEACVARDIAPQPAVPWYRKVINSFR
jgi:hypothetical protein